MAGAVSYSGVDQVAPTGPFTSTISNPLTLLVPAAPGEVVVDVLAADGTGVSLTGGQTQRWIGDSVIILSDQFDAVGIGSEKAGASLGLATSYAFTLFWSGVLGGVALKPAAASPGACPDF